MKAIVITRFGGPEVLELKDVVKFYASDKPVLNGVSFRLYKGETKIIIG